MTSTEHMHNILLITLIIAGLSLSTNTATAQKSENDSIKVDNIKRDGELNYPKKILLNNEFDFKLNKTQSGKFLLSFYKSESKPVVIKIYDITGNLLHRETVVDQGGFSKEYDLSYYKPSFFVVEVGSSKYNKTKSIMAE